MLQTRIKTFEELTITELYSILQLRSEVFVVEQDCVYQDIDGKDKKALHLLGIKNDEVVAYTRIFGPGDYFDTASIGRVVVRDNERKYGYGRVIMEASIAAITERFGTVGIQVSAQAHLEKFYNSLGFKAFGKGYLEDGIPHIGMRR